MSTAPEWRIWTEISQKFDLNFIELPDDLLAELAREGEQDRGTIPAGLYRGIERPIPTVVRTGINGLLCRWRCSVEWTAPSHGDAAESPHLRTRRSAGLVRVRRGQGSR